MEKLNIDLMRFVSSFITPSSFLVLCSTCKQLNSIARDEQIWKAFCLTLFPSPQLQNFSNNRLAYRMLSQDLLIAKSSCESEMKNIKKGMIVFTAQKVGRVLRVALSKPGELTYSSHQIRKAWKT